MSQKHRTSGEESEDSLAEFIAEHTAESVEDIESETIEIDHPWRAGVKYTDEK